MDRSRRRAALDDGSLMSPEIVRRIARTPRLHMAMEQQRLMHE
jgi:hypothetical protein